MVVWSEALVAAWRVPAHTWTSQVFVAVGPLLLFAFPLPAFHSVPIVFAPFSCSVSSTDKCRQSHRELLRQSNRAEPTRLDSLQFHRLVSCCSRIATHQATKPRQTPGLQISHTRLIAHWTQVFLDSVSCTCLSAGRSVGGSHKVTTLGIPNALMRAAARACADVRTMTDGRALGRVASDERAIEFRHML